MVSTRVHQPPNMTRTYIETGILSLTTVVLLVILLVLTVQWSQLRRRALEGREQQVCVKCSLLSDHEEKDTDMCCRNTSMILTELIKKFSRQKFAATEVTRELSNYGNSKCTKYWVPVAVKLTGINRSAQMQEDNQVIHFNGDPEEDMAHFEYRDGFLTVAERGVYFIYSQIKIRYSPEYLDVVFKHWIHQFSQDGTNRKLLESSKSMCEPVSDYNEITFMLGAVFELHLGDKVSAMTSHPDKLSPLDHDHYFRMYIVSH